MRLPVLVAMAAAALALPLSARADLMGDSVHVVVAYPTSTTTFQDLGPITVPGSGTDNTVAAFTVNPNQILITNYVGTQFLPATFLGLEFTDTTKNPNISAVTLDPLSSYTGAGLSFLPNEVLVNLQGQFVPAGATIIVDLSFAPLTPPTPPSAVTPEPSSIALLGTGLLGVAGTMRRRFLQS